MSERIYIDPGHSTVDPGAVGFAVERDLNEKTAKYMHDYLKKHYICESKIDPIDNNSLKEIVDRANEWKASLLVSIHNNAGGGDGYEALIYSEDRINLGKIFEKHVVAIGQNSRGVKLRPGLYVLKHSNMPAILNEGAFVDNKKDIEDWNDDAELKKLGEAYAKAAAEFLNLKKRAAKVETVNITLPTLAYGRKNDQSVKVMQTILNMLGFKVGSTGNFGEGTKAAVMKAQKAYGIPVTGKCDAQTWTKILGM